MSAARLLDALAGEWRFGRTVTLGMAMEGVARFTPLSAGRLAYLEEGKILETRIEFTRAYEYVVDGRDLSIIYADGPDSGKRFLFFDNLIRDTFPFSGKADHLCGRDHYAADFTFASETIFFTHCDIIGPDKAHGITTEYSKL